MNLTDEEIRIKIVESLGWIKQPPSGAYWSEQYVKGKLPSIYESEVRVEGIDFFTISKKQIPNYPESLDACAEFEATLPDEEWLDYIGYLADEVLGYSCSMNPSWSLTRKLLEAPPRQRCLAYLKTKGIIP